MVRHEVGALRERLEAARSVCVLTGSGISAESGLPTFRGAGGLWRSHRVEQLASPEGFARDPLLVWTWYDERRRAHAAAEPSPAHRALVRLEQRVPDFTLATQNVDSLHVRAGSRNVLELHGQLREARCTACSARAPIDRITAKLSKHDRACIEHDCGGIWRPDIVWFGEALPYDVISAAFEAARRADIVLVIGTSALVQPAASIASKRNTRAYVAEINLEETPLSAEADCSLHGRASEIVPLLA